MLNDKSQIQNVPRADGVDVLARAVGVPEDLQPVHRGALHFDVRLHLVVVGAADRSVIPDDSRIAIHV